MNIIPDAAYLSERRVLNGVGPEKNYGFKLARIENDALVYVSPAPADLVLLYAPGDKVLDHSGRKYDDHDVCITRKGRDV